ncbi:hypothetical protein JT318_gp11 [Pseudomonas phage PspYZU01]|uniref:Uncharacterized protein n=1 Tax=Pseudomonas phage PspYZU01 TaxID=1983555 RepID=A0A2U7N4V7_9CAUD|nr:hypothetical protein JT318_gp11 [Pseudomonas phage PspYZU01]ASD51896.1 hypothetical protein PspYZU01_11 [Pseudomonas phage PspYZU01]
MTSRNICYHTRSYANNATKLTGGTFGGAIDADTVERLTKAWFTVRVKPSGRAVFVDRQGREVSLYLSVDPADTEAGKAALRAHGLEAQANAAREEERRRELDDELADLSTDELAALLELRRSKL